MDDTALADNLARDLDAHFEALALAYQNRLFGFARRLSQSPADAEEVVQDALVRAYRALSGYPPERTRQLALRPWLYRITLNVVRNRARRGQVATTPLGDDNEGVTPDALADRADQRPEQLTEQAETRAVLTRLLAQLPPRYRLAVNLRHVDGLSYPELAATLGQPLGTVKANVHRGVKLLRAAFERELGSPVGDVG